MGGIITIRMLGPTMGPLTPLKAPYPRRFATNLEASFSLNLHSNPLSRQPAFTPQNEFGINDKTLSITIRAARISPVSAAPRSRDTTGTCDATSLLSSHRLHHVRSQNTLEQRPNTPATKRMA
jgi:hypothetical protein